MFGMRNDMEQEMILTEQDLGMIITRICACGCGGEFEPYRSTHIYYSKQCKNRAWHWRHEAKRKADGKGYYQKHRAEALAYAGHYRQEHKAQCLVHQHRYRQERKEYIENILRQNICWRCGNNDKRVLLFHHRNPTEKKFDITRANYTLVMIKKEIAKCSIVCANCHRIIHWEMNNG